MQNDLTVKHLKEVLRYEPDTGFFFWKKDLSPRIRKNDRAGSFNKLTGYRRICLDYQGFSEHRLAWFYVHGKWPASQIDHKNRNKSDNRIKNLREATTQQNAWNRKIKDRKLPKNISRDKYSFIVNVKYNGKTLYIGRYKRLCVAVFARNKVLLSQRGDFA